MENTGGLATLTEHDHTVIIVSLLLLGVCLSAVTLEGRKMEDMGGLATLPEHDDKDVAEKAKAFHAKTMNES